MLRRGCTLRRVPFAQYCNNRCFRPFATQSIASGEKRTLSAWPAQIPRQPQEFLEFLRSTGISESVFEHYSARRDRLSRARDNLDFFREVGLAPEKVARTLSLPRNRNMLFIRYPHELRASLDGLVSLGFSRRDAARFVVQGHGLAILCLYMTYDRVLKVLTSLEGSLGISRAQAILVIQSRPHLLSYSPESIQENIRHFVGLFHDSPEVRKRLQRGNIAGCALRVSKESLAGSFDWICRTIFDGDRAAASRRLASGANIRVLVASAKQLHLSLTAWVEIMGEERAIELCRKPAGVSLLRYSESLIRKNSKFLRSLDLDPLAFVHVLGRQSDMPAVFRFAERRLAIPHSNMPTTFCRYSLSTLNDRLDHLLGSDFRITDVREEPKILFCAKTNVAAVLKTLRELQETRSPTLTPRQTIGVLRSLAISTPKATRFRALSSDQQWSKVLSVLKKKTL